MAEVEPASLFDVLSAIHTHRPTLVITDYEMLSCSGETVIRSIREDTVIKDTAVIVLSSQRGAEVVERLSRWNLAAYVLKPLKPEELVEAVSRHFKREAPKDSDGLGPAH